MVQTRHYNTLHFLFFSCIHQGQKITFVKVRKRSEKHPSTLLHVDVVHSVHQRELCAMCFEHNKHKELITAGLCMTQRSNSQLVYFLWQFLPLLDNEDHQDRERHAANAHKVGCELTLFAFWLCNMWLTPQSLT